MSDIAIVMGSKSDLISLKGAFDVLNRFGVGFTARVTRGAESRGIKVMIAGAGMAAALPGMCAALFALPVIGVPLSGKNLDGMDAVFSIMQMPPGVPVATVTAGKAGAKNAALLAISILALSNAELAQKLKEFRVEQTRKVEEADASLQDELAKLN
ncbi:MAG: hypothetical protein BHW17_03555 [Dorea sp. 42_8]|nr:MAG: hypothetical protein BHW17_03555 [Dorea sp. 42_8]